MATALSCGNVRLDHGELCEGASELCGACHVVGGACYVTASRAADRRAYAQYDPSSIFSSMPRFMTFCSGSAGAGMSPAAIMRVDVRIMTMP